MKRLEKKCFLASASVHGLLLMLLLVGPAFLSSSNRKVENFPMLTFIPTRLIDEPFSSEGGGAAGAPTATAANRFETPPVQQAAPPVKQADPPAPTPPEPQPTLKAHQAVAETPSTSKPNKPSFIPSQKKQSKPQPKETSQPKSAVATKPSKTKHVVEPDLTPVKRGADKGAAEKAKADAAAKVRAAREAWKDQITGSLQALRGNLSGSTSFIETPGAGGEAYASYSQYVRKVYTDAWQTPDDVTDENATVTIKVTIARDGTVIAEQSSIAKRSDNAALNRAAENVLLRVSFVAPFPEGAKDSQRTFLINFNLKSKRIAG